MREPGEEPGQPAKQEKPKRLHRATYARDKKKGGYLIRVEGPTADRFAGREVPVTTKAQSEHMEELDTLLWTGKDQETGAPVALYTFVSKPKEDDEQLAF